MTSTVENLLNNLKDPIKEIGLIRSGLKTHVIESFLAQEDWPVKDVLNNLHIPSSTYFSKKKSHKPLDAYTTEKFIRLVSVTVMATEILGKNEGKNWLLKKIPSLNNQMPIHLLDTETGHRLVEQTLLQIKYGVYG